MVDMGKLGRFVVLHNIRESLVVRARVNEQSWKRAVVGSAVSGSMAPSTTTAPPLLSAWSLSNRQPVKSESESMPSPDSSIAPPHLPVPPWKPMPRAWMLAPPVKWKR